MMYRDAIVETERAARRTLLTLALAVAIALGMVFLTPALAEAQEAGGEPQEPGAEASVPVAVDDEYAVPVGGRTDVDLLENDDVPDGAIVCSMLLPAEGFSGRMEWKEEGQSFEAGRMTYTAPSEAGTYTWSYEVCATDGEGGIVSSEPASVTFDVFAVVFAPPPVPEELLNQMRGEVRVAKENHAAAKKTFRAEVRQLRKADTKAERRAERKDVRAAAKKSERAAVVLKDARASLRAMEAR